jgi:branched-chain amino acid transport system substrate-binding protein
MVVVTIAFLTGVAVVGGVSTLPAADAQIPYPRLHIGPPSAIIGQGGWIDGDTVMVVIDDPNDPVDRTLTAIAGSDEIHGDSWRIEDESLGLEPGFIITASDSATSRIHEIKPIAFERVVIDTETVTGSTSLVAGDWVEVAVFSDECRRRNVPVAGGFFTADFSVPGGGLPDEAATCDLAPGSFGSVEQYDDDGDLTFVSWEAPPLPWVTGDVGENRIWGGGDWSLTSALAVSVDDPSTGDVPDFATTAMMEQMPWDPSVYEFVLDLGANIDLQPGFEIVVTGPDHVKNLTLTSLEITNVDFDSDLVQGLADDTIPVWIDGGNDEEFDWAFRLVDSTGGAFTADFAQPGTGGNEEATVDLVPGSRGTAQQYDDDGDYTHAFWHTEPPPGGPLDFFERDDLLISQTDGTIWVYSQASGELLHYGLPFGDNYDIQYLDQATLLIAGHGNGSVFTLDLASGHVREIFHDDTVWPIGLALHPIEPTLYVSDEGSGIYGFDFETGSLTQITAVAGHTIALGPNGWIYFTNEGDPLRKVNPTTGQVELVADAYGYQYLGFVFAPDGHIVMLSAAPNAVLDIDPATGVVTERAWALPNGDPPGDLGHMSDLVLMADGSVYFVSNGNSGLFHLDASGILWELHRDPLGDAVDMILAQTPPSELEVAIDIQPGQYPNSLNIDGHGVIPVAVLGDDSFDVTQIDAATLDFAGLEVRVKKNGSAQCSIEDVSGDFTHPEGAPDGFLDLVCRFVDDPPAWMPDDGTATLTGRLLPAYGGTAFSGSDEYQIVPPTRCTDSFGCAEYGADDPIVIGAALALTGLPDLGFGELQGTQLAVSQRGDLFGRSLAALSEDAQCSPDGGATAASTLVADPTVVAVVGTSCSSSALAAAPIITATGNSMVSPSNTSPMLTDPSTHEAGYLRVAYNDRVQAEALAGFAHTGLAATTSAIIRQDDLYSAALAETFVESFTDLGGSNLTIEVIDSGSPDIEGAVANVIAAGPPDLIYVLAFEPLGSQVVTEVRAQPALTDTQIASSDVVLSGGFIAETGAAAEGVYATAVASPSGPAYDAFVAAYEAEFGEPPATDFDAYAFDAANMILDAIADVGTEHGATLLVGRQQLRDTLFATAGLEGVTGTIACNANGDCAAPQTVQLWQIQAGEFVLVVP